MFWVSELDVNYIWDVVEHLSLFLKDTGGVVENLALFLEDTDGVVENSSSFLEDTGGVAEDSSSLLKDTGGVGGARPAFERFPTATCPRCSEACPPKQQHKYAEPDIQHKYCRRGYELSVALHARGIPYIARVFEVS